MDTSPIEIDETALLPLQQMETALIRGRLASPGVLLPREYQLLRYALGLARLSAFVPGAALGAPRGEELQVDPALLAALRACLMSTLAPALRSGTDPGQRLAHAGVACAGIEPLVRAARAAVAEQLRDRCAPAELDAEIGRKTLVSVAGGGGGAGFVYIGAYARLHAGDARPGYIVGSSIGTLIGAFRARTYEPDFEGLLDFAKKLRRSDVFGIPAVLAPHSMPGIARLHLEGVHREMRNVDGEPLRLRDMALPFDAVVGGIRKRVYERLPRPLTRPQARGNARFSRRLSERLWQLTSFVSPNIVKEVVLGRDPRSSEVEVAEAIGFSAAIPGVLQYHPKTRSAHMKTLLDGLCEDLGLAVLVDGGVANNVAARTAWRSVQGGRIGTRNVFVLAWDCFQPRFDPAHAWLAPVTQALQVQMPANRPYFDWLLQFEHTLSPVNLLPPAVEFDRSYRWGWDQMGAAMPLVEEALRPVELPPSPGG